MFLFLFFRPIETPAKVPPVPIAQVKPSFFSITHYSQIIFGIIISIFIFNHYPSSIELLGAVMIIVSGYLIYAKLKKLN